MKRVLRFPLGYFGGKYHLVNKLLPLLPPHRIYVEAFGGVAHLLFSKQPAYIEVYNDVDSHLVNFFRVLRDPEKFERFHRLAYLTPYSREEYSNCYDRLFGDASEPIADDVERAWAFYVAVRMGFNGFTDYKSWSNSLVRNKAAKWARGIDILPEISHRLRTVVIENRDFRELFPLYDTDDTLWYLDPPYVPDTRRSGRFRHELSLEDHQELVQRILQLRGMVILSGYRHAVHQPLEEAGWDVRHFQATICASRITRTNTLPDGRKQQRTLRIETVWLNPQAVGRLSSKLFEER